MCRIKTYLQILVFSLFVITLSSTSSYAITCQAACLGACLEGYQQPGYGASLAQPCNQHCAKHCSNNK